MGPAPPAAHTTTQASKGHTDAHTCCAWGIHDGEVSVSVCVKREETHKHRASRSRFTVHKPEDAVWFKRMHWAKQSATAGT